MTHDGTGPTGQRWMTRWRVPAIAVLAALVVIGLVAAVVWASGSPDSPQQVAASQPGQPSSRPSVTATRSPEASITPSPSATPQAPPPDAGQPAPQPGSPAKPVVTAFAATANGLEVTVSFTLNAQADRGPFTCSIRRASIGTDEFSCNAGPVSRTYDYDFCCGSEIYVIATDRNGVSSDQWNGSVDFPRPDRPTYSNLAGRHDGGTVFVQFSVASAPGDDPKCDIDISQGLAGSVHRSDDMPCEGTVEVSFAGAPGTYYVSIGITSDSHFNPLAPNQQPVTVG